MPSFSRTLLSASVLFGLAISASLCGCGGGGNDGSPTNSPSPTATATATPVTGNGRLTLSVQWPARSRGIPAAANSVRVLIEKQGYFVRSALLVRPASGAATSAVLEGLPLGEVSLSVFAYPEVQGTGVLQGSAVLSATVTEQEGTVVALTAASKIDHLIVPDPYNLQVGQTASLQVQARDVNEQLVITDPSTFQWTSSDLSVATVTNGLLEALAPGTTTLTVTETESGLVVSKTVQVRAAPIPTPTPTPAPLPVPPF